MEIRTYKTPKVVAGDDLFTILDQNLPKLSEKSIVVVTSKIVSICQGRVIKNDGSVDKKELIRNQAEYFIDNEQTARYGILLTIKENILIASAGIDESNGNGYFVLWPHKSMETAASIWRHLKARDGITHLGVLITDSRVTPLRWGTVGVGLSWCGFEPLNTYIGSKDIFGRTLKVTKSSVIDGLAGASVLAMGEGNEQTPLAIITDAPMVRFTSRPPTKEETEALRISLADDIYAPLINSTKWKKGGS